MYNAYDKLVAEQRYDLTECYVRNFDFVIYWDKLKIEIVPFETTKSKGPYENGHTSVSLRYNAGMIDNAKRDFHTCFFPINLNFKFQIISAL